jgi:hypothetical protein
MNIKANYKKVKQGFRIEVNGVLMWETKTKEAAEGLTELLNQKLVDAYLEGHADAKRSAFTIPFDDLEEPDVFTPLGLWGRGRRLD